MTAKVAPEAKPTTELVRVSNLTRQGRHHGKHTSSIGFGKFRRVTQPRYGAARVGRETKAPEANVPGGREKEEDGHGAALNRLWVDQSKDRMSHTHSCFLVSNETNSFFTNFIVFSSSKTQYVYKLRAGSHLQE